MGPKLLYKNGDIYSCGLVLGVDGLAQRQFNGLANEVECLFWLGKSGQGYSVIPGECVLMKRRSFMDVEGFSTSLAELLHRCLICV